MTQVYTPPPVFSTAPPITARGKLQASLTAAAGTIKAVADDVESAVAGGMITGPIDDRAAMNHVVELLVHCSALQRIANAAEAMP